MSLIQPVQEVTVTLCLSVSVASRRWRPGQPDSWTGHGFGPGDEDCAHLHSDGRLNDLHCSTRLRYICQRHSQRSWAAGSAHTPLTSHRCSSTADCKHKHHQVVVLVLLPVQTQTANESPNMHCVNQSDISPINTSMSLTVVVSSTHTHTILTGHGLIHRSE